MEDELQEAANELEDFLETDSPTEKNEDISQTKAFSERLKKEKEKLVTNERENLAHSLGYDNWEELQKGLETEKILNKGLDPDIVKPLIKEMMESDPMYKEALKYKKEKEELQKELWAKSEIDSLNKKFGTNYTTISDLDAETIELWNNGLSLDKAFAANNYTKIADLSLKRVTTGKEHLKEVKGSAAADITILSAEQIKLFKDLNPGVTDNQIKEYINKK